MTQEQIYQNIARRTGGDIYIGVVGPVRTGKSTFIKRFSELLLLPHIQNEAQRARANDELPQSAAGRTIMTTEPKFIPEKAVNIELSGGGSFRARLIDCVGYMVDGALGHEEQDAPRLVKSPWFDHEVPFDLAAETGTLRYVTAIAEAGTLSEAARRFYIAQPSLTASLRELEEELGLTIFRRTNRGAVLTPEGEEFLGYARQVLAQMDLMEEKYLGAAPVKHQFCVSTQHYSFAVEAFVELLREYGGPEYDFRIRETQTYELIEDVALLRSEVGVLYLNKDNETVLRKVIREHDLQFTPLFTAKPHVFVSASSPLAAKPAVTLDDLAPYPRLSYEQGEHNAFYFSEEILSTRDSKKDILVSDRATLFNLLIGLNGYTICSGVISESLNGPNIVAVPLLVDDAMQIGYLTHKQVQPGLFGKRYIEILQRHTAQ